MAAPMTRRFMLAALVAGPLALTTASAAPAAAPAREPAIRAVARTAREQHPLRIHIAGDSTAAQKYAPAAPETGWGMALPWYVAARTEVLNHAMNGRSSRTFVEEGRLASILADLRAGDVLLVQFGHNDEKSDPLVRTDPWTSYQSFLRLYVDGARQRGAVPVLLTPAERWRFDDDGNAVATHGRYPDAMRALAADEGVPLIDITAQTIARWQQLGPGPSRLNFLRTAEGVDDNTHFNATGAAVVGQMVARGLLATGVLAENALRRLDEDVPASWFTWPEPVPAVA